MNFRDSLSLASSAMFAIATVCALGTSANADDTTKVVKPNVTFYFIPG